MRVTDNRDPERHADAAVQVRVNRNRENPEFQGQPYVTDLSENQPIGATVFAPVARDKDIQVCGLLSFNFQIRECKYCV